MLLLLAASIGACPYPYMRDLSKLDSYKPHTLKPTPKHLNAIITPLKQIAWQQQLAHHPDQGFTKYITNGIANGFRIGFNRRCNLKSTQTNMKSTSEHPEVVEEYLAKELSKGRTIELQCQSTIPTQIQISRFGVIPKRHQPGQWRLIIDLSSPEGKSINDGIDKSLCSLQYIKVEEVAKQVFLSGQGTLMGKTDVKSAFRIVPVHPDDRPLLGMQWRDKLFVDATLPFGLRSAPKIFNAVADALQWVIKEHGVSFLEHYLDDFITIGSPSSNECHNNMDTLFHVCNILGVPLAEDKTVHPTTSIVFLGIEIDSVEQELRLPVDKLSRISSCLDAWMARKRATKRELESLAGTLEDAAKIIKPGRTFLRRIYDTISTLAKQNHHTHINKALRSDIAWWQTFVRSWNGVSLMSTLCTPTPNTSMVSDASGSWGCGAIWKDCWFQLAWNDDNAYQQENIATKELLPIVIAAAIWGPHWQGNVVSCECDNQAVVAVLTRRTCRDHNLMHLLRCLFFFEAHFQFSLLATHIPGSSNDLADDLSRDKLSSFIQKTGNSSAAEPTPIPQELTDMLMTHRPDWASDSWRQMFSCISKKV